MEKREIHTRENFILLSHLGSDRLKQLGIYQAWKPFYNFSKKYEYFHLRGEVGLCEGSISKTVFGMEEIIQDDKVSKHILLIVNCYYGPNIFLSIGSRDIFDGKKQLRHLVCPQIDSGTKSFIFFKIPVVPADPETYLESYLSRRIRSIAKQHDPSEIQLVTQKPLTSQETRLKQRSYGNNVLFISDAARSGNYNSGIGFNLISFLFEI